MDAYGNTVWGMITTVDAKERKVSFAVTADDLRSALRRARAQLDVRIADDVDAQARQAMDGLLARHETEKAALRTESEREIERLREAVRSLKSRVRDPAQAEAAAPAWASLTQGDPGPAADLLRARARHHGAEAASASRQLAALLTLSDSVAALAAYREAASFEPKDADTWLAIGWLEHQAGSIQGALQAFEAALALIADDHPSRFEALVGLGDTQFAAGDLAGALALFQAGLDIRTRLAERRSGQQRMAARSLGQP